MLGLGVNAKKTQMVCVNATITNNLDTYIRNPVDKSRISGGKELKILGFYFDNRPTVDRHVEEIEKKFRRRVWLLRNLKRAKIDNNELVSAYCSFIRPVIEFCSSIYHPMLNKNLNLRIEKLQYSALRIIYGYELERHELLKKSGLGTLEERREALFAKFCLKLYNNQRFKTAWLPERNFIGHCNIKLQRIFQT